MNTTTTTKGTTTMIGAIHTPLPDCPKRDARHASDEALMARVENLIRSAVVAYVAGHPFEHLLAEAITIADSDCPSPANERITRRLFNLALEGKAATLR